MGLTVEDLLISYKKSSDRTQETIDSWSGQSRQIVKDTRQRTNGGR